MFISLAKMRLSRFAVACMLSLCLSCLAQAADGEDQARLRLDSALPAPAGESDAAAAPANPLNLLALILPSPPEAKPVPASVLAEEELSAHPINPPLAVAAPIDLTAPADTLWQRIRYGFAMPDLNNDLVLHWQQWYQNRPEALRRMVERSSRYMYFIVEQLEERGMPTELALLPMVESSFNPMAYSPAHASGLWQFIPATGRRYNLEQNGWRDERRDIVASTEAALDYLKDIYELNGDWHLALASYNWGEQAVRRAMDKNESRGLPSDYANLTLPNETRHYVPKLQALKNIFSNPVLMAELQIPDLLNQPYFTTVSKNRPIDLKTAARLAEMPVDEFVALNAAHKRPVIPADTPLVLPADRLATFEANLQRHAGPLSHWQSYTLRPGERLDKLAPRFGISLTDLKRVNGFSGNLKIGAGTTLLVPADRLTGRLEDVAVLPRLPQIASKPPSSRKTSAQASKAKPARTSVAGKALAHKKVAALHKADKMGGKAGSKTTSTANASKTAKLAKPVAKPAPKLVKSAIARRG